MGECIECGKELNTTFVNGYEIDDYGDIWCIPCAEKESDTGEIY